MPPAFERLPGGMARDFHPLEVVHSSPAEVSVGDRKTCRLDDVRLDIQAGAEAENRSGILRNVRLEKSYAHGVCGHSSKAVFLGKSHSARGICTASSRQCEGGLALPRQGCQ